MHIMPYNTGMIDTACQTQEVHTRPLAEGTKVQGKENTLHNEVVQACSSPEKRAELVRWIDSESTNQSERIKKKSDQYTPILVIGTGAHATAFATEYTSKHNNAEILFLDKSDKRGGQFRSFNEPYLLNSTNFAENTIGIQLANNNPNDLSSKSSVQVTAYSQSRYPTSQEMGDAVVINNYLAGNAMLGVEVVAVRKSRQSKGKYEVMIWDAKAQKYHYVYTDKIINATGLGNPDTTLKPEKPHKDKKIVSFLEFMVILDKLTTKEQTALLNQKKIAIVGAGDSAYITIEKILEKAKLIGTREVTIDLFGAQFSTQDEFNRKIIDRYMHLLPYMRFSEPGDKRNIKSTTSVRRNASEVSIYPQRDRADAVFYNYRGVPFVTAAKEHKPYDLVISATGFKNTVLDIYKDLDSHRTLSLVPIYEFTSFQRVCEKVVGEEVYFVGAAANIPYTAVELQLVPEKMRRRYQHSLRRLIPRTTYVAHHIVK